jgi:two-component system cell cycle response regulator
VAVGDLDAFKTVNDRYGHAGGDDVLRETGHRLREFCRATDMVARYGGEEFLIVMFDADVDGALHRLQEFQDAFAAEPIALRNGATVHITMSIGVSSCPADATNVADLIAIADARMYSAKSVRRGPTLHWPKSVAAS